jgi:hypothetical protein
VVLRNNILAQTWYNMWDCIMDRLKCIFATLLYFRVSLNWTFPWTIRLDIQAIPKYIYPIVGPFYEIFRFISSCYYFFFFAASLLGRHMATSYELILFRNQKWRRCYKSYVWARREGFLYTLYTAAIRTTQDSDNAARTNAFNIGSRNVFFSTYSDKIQKILTPRKD